MQGEQNGNQDSDWILAEILAHLRHYFLDLRRRKRTDPQTNGHDHCTHRSASHKPRWLEEFRKGLPLFGWLQGITTQFVPWCGKDTRSNHSGKHVGETARIS